MSEKATLLQSLPPLQKTDSPAAADGSAGKLKLLSSSPVVETPPEASSKSARTPESGGGLRLLSTSGNAERSAPESGSGERLSLLSTARTPRQSPPAEEVAPAPPSLKVLERTETDVATEKAEVQESMAKSLQMTETQVVDPAGTSISAFQFLTYGSFITSFILAGFVAVVLFRKASSMVAARHQVASRALGGIFLLVALHGFVATFFYNRFLWGEASLPLLFSLGLWVIAGPALAVVLSHLLTRFDRPVRKNLLINAAFFFVIYLLALSAASGSIRVNAAVIIGLLSVFLFIVPVARYLQNFATARARHKELKDGPAKLCVYTLLLGSRSRSGAGS